MSMKICIDCGKKIFYNNSKHECIKYEPVSMKQQEDSDERDDLNNTNFKNRFMCDGQKYKLVDAVLFNSLENVEKEDDIRKNVVVEEVVEGYRSYVKTECEFCGFKTTYYYRDRHQMSKKCQNMKKKYYRGD